MLYFRLHEVIYGRKGLLVQSLLSYCVRQCDLLEKYSRLKSLYYHDTNEKRRCYQDEDFVGIEHKMLFQNERTKIRNGSSAASSQGSIVFILLPRIC